MIQKLFFLFALLGLAEVCAQEDKSLYHSKKISSDRDTLTIDSVSINSSFFKLLNAKQEPIDSSFYKVNFAKGTVTFKNGFTTKDTLTVNYLKFPDFVTKEYTIYDKSKVVSNNALGELYKSAPEIPNTYKPFDGLNTSGSITRGISVGNNQNASLNSNLDLQVTGKLSDKVSLRASLQDNNIPLQEGGYSQKLDEFDQIFIELFSDKWNIRAGDLFLENRKSRFLNFNKKVQGLATNFSFGSPENKTNVFASGAIVRGQYAKSSFVGQEGNQGPYKLRGPNNEPFILVISGSERVYVNGILQTRGENNQYVIDYNAGEVTFTSLFPITSEMRIAIEYQFSDRNYTRFVTYAGTNHDNEKWSLGGALYSENDIKNQPVQQNLSPDQAQILVNAGDNQDAMNALSAIEETYSENKILYKKALIGLTEIFEYSTNATDVLFNVKFSLVGENKGNYILKTSNANGRVYEYVTPIAAVPQGNYEPIIKLVAPTKIQIATVFGKYNPSEETNLDFELGVSNNDKNLFSSSDDNDNQGLATKININQQLFSKKWKVTTHGNLQFIQENFKSIERIFNIEFDRDWNLLNPTGNQSIFSAGFDFELPTKSNWVYQFENLNFTNSFSGNRHSISGFYKLKGWNIQSTGSIMKSSSNEANSRFIRNTTQLKYKHKKYWLGTSFRHENNQEQNKSTQNFSAISQRFTEMGALTGVGDSTKVFVEIGYLKRENDSLQLGKLQKVNTSNSYFLKSKLFNSNKKELSLFVNYRNLKFEDNRNNEPSLNTRILYNASLVKDKIQLGLLYENNSGTIAQQEFSFLEVEAGRGVYAWNDYNTNGIQEIQEFEIAPFPDLAKFVKIFLPNQVFVKTHQNRFSPTVILNPISWFAAKGYKKILSHFYNQTSFLVERKIKRTGDNFDLNPFATNAQNLLGLTSNFRNNLFFNRGKQHHSVTYTFLNSKFKNLQISDEFQTQNKSHQLQYIHLLNKSWLFTAMGNVVVASNSSVNYASRNFEIKGNEMETKIGYLFSKNASWDIFYKRKKKQNEVGNSDLLQNNQFGTSFAFASDKKITLNGEFSFINNQFTGNPFSPVGFQMLEGLQVGKNSTWRLLVQKNLTQYLDININYQGRKSETSNAIHTGNIQLRAYF